MLKGFQQTVEAFEMVYEQIAEVKKGRSGLPQSRGCRGVQLIKPLPADLAIGVLSG